MRILHVEPRRYGAAARALLESVGTVDYVECASQEEFAKAAGRHPYDAIFVRLGLRADASILRPGRAPRWLVTPTTGLDHVDLEAAAASRTEVLSLRGETAFLDGIRSTAEHTWALLLSLARHIPAARGDVLEGRWRRDPFEGFELAERTIAIVGVGRLGRMVAEIALAFRMRVLGVEISEDARRRAPDGVAFVPLEEALGAADVVSLHLPLDPATRGYLSRQRIAQMKPGALLVNTARGELVDEDALAEALTAGRLGGAALDVLDGDGGWDGAVPARGNPLVDLARTSERVVITPHVGGYGTSSLERTRMFMVEKFVAAVKRSENG